MNEEREIDVSDEALHHQDVQTMQQTVIDAILKARPLLSDDELMALAWSAGVTNEIYKELRK